MLKIGILAGGGKLPLAIGNKLIEIGYEVEFFCIEPFAQLSDYYQYKTKRIKLESLSNILTTLKKSNIQQIVIDELPDNFGPPSVSSTFKNKFKEIAKPHAINPANDTDHLISELYGATKFGKFHSESSAAMEKSTNSLLGGLIKDAIGTVINSKIIYHGDNKLKDRDGNLVALEEGYKRFPREYVQEYVKVHKRLTRQLLDYMYHYQVK